MPGVPDAEILKFLKFGIGQAPKTPQYLRTNMFNGLHGRSLPVASGIKVAHPALTVVAEGGDGDMYGEGGNHFLHTIRRNPDIVHIVHNNMVYGLTKGQASPTSRFGFKTPVQIDGVASEPVNPMAVAIAQNASFVGRAFSGDTEESIRIIQEAVQHKGYALVDIFQPCVTFNKVNTFKWFKENTACLSRDHDPADRSAAFKKAVSENPYYLGVFYRCSRPVFEEQAAPYADVDTPLYRRERTLEKLKSLLEEKRAMVS